MGDIRASSEDGKFDLGKWLKGGFIQPGRKPPPARPDNDEENDEPEDEEAAHYGLEDTRKPKYMAQGPTTQSVSALVSTPAFSSTKLCAGCKLDIGQGTYRYFMGTFFHPQCFCCRTCGRPIADHEKLSSAGSSQPYHKSCYDDSSHLSCDVCRRFIPSNMFGPIEYRIHPFWSQKYCQRHDFDYTPRCCGCDRLQPWDAMYIPLGDGRKLCSECKQSAMMSIGECPPLYQAVRGFFEGMRMMLDRPLSVRLVDKLGLDQAMMHDTRSLGVYPITPCNTSHSIMRRSEIIVLLVYGFPRLALGSWLAGRLTKEWLLLRGYYRIPPELREALCRLLSWRWLESEVKKVRESEAEKNLGEFLLHKKANATCPAHRGAFLATKAAVDKYGLHQTLDHINLTGFLPR